MKRCDGIAVLVSLLTWGMPALAFDGQPPESLPPPMIISEPRQPYTGPSLLAIDKEIWARALRDYGMWREEQDRNTFPTDMPKVGEPYDPITGNVIRR